MKVNRTKKSVFLGAFTLVSFIGSIDLLAGTTETTPASKQVGNDAQEQMSERRQKLNEDAV